MLPQKSGWDREGSCSEGISYDPGGSRVGLAFRWGWTLALLVGTLACGPGVDLSSVGVGWTLALWL